MEIEQSSQDKAYLERLDSLSKKALQGQIINKQYLLGTIIDYQPPLLSKRQSAFISKLKIIDSSLNCNTHQSTLPYIQVIIFNSDKEQLPKVYQVGDIAYLSRFDVTRSQKEVKAKNNLNLKSSFRIIDSQSQGIQVKSSNTNKEIQDEHIIKEIASIKSWTHNFFSQTSIQEMCFYNVQEIMTNSTIQQAKFDLILTINKISCTNIPKTFNFTLKDANKNIFYLHFNNDENIFKQDQIIIVKQIKSVDVNYQIEKSEQTTMLIIHESFCDAINVIDIYYKIIKGKSAEVWQFHNFQDFENQTDKNSATLILSKHKKTLEDSCIKNLQKIKLNNKPLRLKVYIINFEHKELNQAVSYLCQRCKKYYKFEFKPQICCQLKTKPCFFTEIMVKDQSIDFDVKIQQLYILGFDGQGNQLFQNINVENITEENYEEKNEFYKQKINDLIKNTTTEYFCDVIVQPLTYKNNTIYRIIDTVFK